MTQKGGQIYQITFEYKGMTFRLKDSLKHIQMKLADFNKNLKLGMQYEKEIMPYAFYNEHTIKKQLNPISEFLAAIEKQSDNPEEDKKHVLEVLKKDKRFMKGEDVDIIEYCRYYCRRDCDVL